MFTFINILSTNSDGIHIYSYKEIKKLYKFYLYLFRPKFWAMYKIFYRIRKNIVNRINNLF